MEKILNNYDKLSPEKKARVNELLKLIKISDGREDLTKFTEYTFKKFKPESYHYTFYDILNRFINKEIKNLAISMPPQHGKTEGATRRTSSFVVGKRPDDKIAIVSYSATISEKFGREIMNIIRQPEYKELFPNVMYPERGYTGQKANTNKERESINSEGSLRLVGVGGPLTSQTIDLLLMDDLYKDWAEANSPTVQRAVWDWYIAVGETRLHNDSQQLLTFTRWSENDLIAQLDDKGLIVVYDGTQDLDELIENLGDKFLMINFQALKEGQPNDFDKREEGEALWEARHSRKKLESTRAKDPDKFDCLYQGNPQNKEGMLYSDEFKTYKNLPQLKMKKNYTDTADSGKDYLCSIVYGIPLSSTDPHKYVIDILYTQKGMEVTEPLTAKMLNKHKVNKTKIESNNGGKGFARNVEKLVDKGVNIFWFHQSNNKEARIYSNSASVNKEIVFPDDWHVRWPIFYKHVTKYKKLFALNDFDDAQDTLTGIIETEENKEVVHTTEASADDLGLF